MNRNPHERAQELILIDAGAASAPDQRWLQEHLAGCAQCSALLERTHAVRSALHSLPLTADPAMVEATRRRALRYALELGERESRRWLLTLSTVVAAGFAWLTVPLLWQASSWLGGMTSAPQATTLAVYLTAAVVPAVLAAAAAMGLRGAALGNGSTMSFEGNRR